MKIFISWSQDYSKDIANALKPWMKSVLQATNPFVSDSDIDLGTLPLNKIDEQLNDSKLGIIIVTPENYRSPWINYEAGAISNAIAGETKVIPILFGIKISELGTDPLTKFQLAKEFDKETILKVIQSINNELNVGRLDSSMIEETFELWWPKLEEKVKCINKKYSHTEVKAESNTVLEGSEKGISYDSQKTEKLYELTEKNSRMIQEMATLMHSSTLEDRENSERIKMLQGKNLHQRRMLANYKNEISNMKSKVNLFLQSGDIELLMSIVDDENFGKRNVKSEESPLFVFSDKNE